jgi:hypothetical protein
MHFKLVQEDAREYSLSITEIDVEGGPDHLTLWLDHEEAVQLFEAVDAGIGEWIADYRLHKALYEATKHKHEDEEAGRDAYPPDHPKSTGFAERMLDAVDQARKSERESR